MGVHNAVNPHISYSMTYSEWDAAIAAGATLDELARLEKYPKTFRAKLVAWRQYSSLIHMHSEDAVSQDMKRRGKR